jgi:hypothetical protein
MNEVAVRAYGKELARGWYRSPSIRKKLVSVENSRRTESTKPAASNVVACTTS